MVLFLTFQIFKISRILIRKSFKTRLFATLVVPTLDSRDVQNTRRRLGRARRSVCGRRKISIRLARFAVSIISSRRAGPDAAARRRSRRRPSNYTAIVYCCADDPSGNRDPRPRRVVGQKLQNHKALINGEFDRKNALSGLQLSESSAGYVICIDCRRWGMAAQRPSLWVQPKTWPS